MPATIIQYTDFLSVFRQVAEHFVYFDKTVFLCLCEILFLEYPGFQSLIKKAVPLPLALLQIIMFRRFLRKCKPIRLKQFLF